MKNKFIELVKSNKSLIVLFLVAGFVLGGFVLLVAFTHTWRGNQSATSYDGFMCDAGGYRCTSGYDLNQEELLRALKGEEIDLGRMKNGEKGGGGVHYVFNFSEDYTKKEDLEELRRAIDELKTSHEKWIEKHGSDESKMDEGEKWYFSRIQRSQKYQGNLLRALEEFEKELPS